MALAHQDTWTSDLASPNSAAVEDLDRDRPKNLTQDEIVFWDSVSSKFNYYAGYVTSSSINLWLLSRALVNDISLPRFAVLALSGYFLWTLVEYWFHRYMYHHGPKLMKLGHQMHHDAPRAFLGLPYYYHGAVYVIVYLIFSHIFSPASVGTFMGFFGIGHLSYNATHHATHHWNFKNPLFKKIKAHHLTHHHRDGINFGITCPYWDTVFGTRAPR